MKKLLILLLTGMLFGQANNVFTINPSISSAGQGNTGIGDFNSDNLFHNPAFVVDNQSVDFSYVAWLPNLVDDLGYFNLQYTSGQWGVEVFHFDYGSQLEANEGGVILGEFNSTSTRLGVSYGHELWNWNLGYRFNILNHNFYHTNGSSNGYTFDVGAYKTFNDTNVGLVLKNIGIQKEFEDDKVTLPTSLGLGVKQSFGDFHLLSDLTMYQDYLTYGLGGKYELGLASLKFGMYSEPDFDVNYFTFGGGIKTDYINIDVAYLFNNDSVHNQTLMLSFGFDL